jgi:hypothetical protein
MSELIWSRENLTCLFHGLKRKFGPYSQWSFRAQPSIERGAEYAHWLDKFADIVGAESVDAVGFIVLAAVHEPMRATHNRKATLVRAYSAALDSGFLHVRDFETVKPVGPNHATLVPLLAA